MSDTIATMTTKVQDSLLRLKKICGDRPDLLKIIDQLAYAWDHAASELIMLAVGIHSFKYRDNETSIALLEKYQDVITNKQIAISALFGGESKAVN